MIYRVFSTYDDILPLLAAAAAALQATEQAAAGCADMVETLVMELQEVAVDRAAIEQTMAEEDLDEMETMEQLDQIEELEQLNKQLQSKLESRKKEN